MSREREALLRLYGARVEVVESLGGMNEAVDAARAMAQDADVFLPDQFSNPANPEAHRTATGPEILRALDGRVDVFVAGIGTGGTITGVGEALKAADPSTLVIAVEPAAVGRSSRAGRPGRTASRASAPASCPAVLDREVVDEVLACPDEDAIEAAHLLAAREGVLAGMSCGAAVWAAIEVAERARVARQAHRHRAPRLGRALHLRAVLRAERQRARRLTFGPARAGVYSREPCSPHWRPSPVRSAVTSPPRGSAIRPRAECPRSRSC